MDELVGAPEMSQVFIQPWRIASSLEPASGAFLTDCGSEGLIEVGVASREQALVRQLMKNDLGQICVVFKDEGVKHGILEPPQRGIGADASNGNVKPFGPQ